MKFVQDSYKLSAYEIGPIFGIYDEIKNWGIFKTSNTFISQIWYLSPKLFEVWCCLELMQQNKIDIGYVLTFNFFNKFEYIF